MQPQEPLSTAPPAAHQGSWVDWYGQRWSTVDRRAWTRRTMGVLWIVYVMLLLWYTSGALPFGPNQGDAVQEASGVEHIVRYGWDAPLLTHNFVGCPGVTTTLVLIRRATGIEPLSILSALCMLAGVVFNLSAAGLGRRLTGLATPLCGIVVLLSPIAISIGMYANDLIMAAACATSALFLFAGRLHWLNCAAGAVLLGFAGWYRADAILITPAIPFLLYRGNWRAMLRWIVVIGLGAALVALALVYGSGSNLHAILAHAEAVADHPGRAARILGFYVSFFPLIMVYLLALGIIRLIRQRCGLLICLCIAGIVPLWSVMLTYPLPKYHTYVVPFFAVVCLVGLGAVLSAAPSRRRRVHLTLITLLFVGQYVIGARIALRDKPWWDELRPTPVTLYEKKLPRGRIDDFSLVIGPGTFNPFGHAGTPISGLLFTPLVYQEEKRVARKFMDEYIAYVAALQDPELRFFGMTHRSVQWSVYALVHAGFRCLENKPFGPKNHWRLIWKRDGQHVVQYRLAGDTYDMTYLRSLGELSGIYPMGSGREESVILEQATSADLIARTSNLGTYAAYRVTFPPLEKPAPTPAP